MWNSLSDKHATGELGSVTTCLEIPRNKILRWGWNLDPAISVGEYNIYFDGSLSDFVVFDSTTVTNAPHCSAQTGTVLTLTQE